MKGTTICINCGEQFTAANPVCCDTEHHDDGSHTDGVCRSCCGPHTPFNPQVEFFPL